MCSTAFVNVTRFTEGKFSVVIVFRLTSCVYFLMDVTCVIFSALPLIVLTCALLQQCKDRPSLPLSMWFIVTCVFSQGSSHGSLGFEPK